VFDADIMGIDLDDCRDPETGELTAFAQQMLRRFDTYAEVSPSGCGVKIFVLGTWDDTGKKKIIEGNKIEVYPRGRFFTVTGAKVPDAPCTLRDCQAELDALHAELTAPASGYSHNGNGHAPQPLSDRSRIIDRARKYVAKMDPAISGQFGHDRAFHAACILVLGFNLSVNEALPVLSEWNISCIPPFSEKDLLHKLSDADKRPETRGWLLAATDRREVGRQNSDNPTRTEGDHNEPLIERHRGRLKLISSAELAATNIRLQYLVEPVLVAGQPCILAGGKKTLKTNISIDLVLSLAHAGLFLGKFKAPEAVQVALLSGESGQATIAETARRIAASKGWSLEHFENANWGFNLPRLGEPGCREALDEFIRENELSVVIIDPTYLALPLGDSAGNLFQVGEKLVEINEVFEANGCTPIFSHHTRKNSISPFEPPELEDIAWAGFQEWARQWVLIGRRRKYDPEQGGHHELWLNIGGSAGHSSLWALNVNEGTREDVGGRRWDLEIVKPSEARAEAADDEHEKRRTSVEQKRSAQAEADREKVLKAFRLAPDGDSKSQIRDSCGIPTGRFGVTLAALIEARTIEACEIRKGNKQVYSGYRLTREHSCTVGIPGLTG
jgi:hypothetical protein